MSLQALHAQTSGMGHSLHPQSSVHNHLLHTQTGVHGYSQQLRAPSYVEASTHPVELDSTRAELQKLRAQIIRIEREKFDQETKHLQELKLLRQTLRQEYELKLDSQRGEIKTLERMVEGLRRDMSNSRETLEQVSPGLRSIQHRASMSGNVGHRPRVREQIQKNMFENLHSLGNNRETSFSVLGKDNHTVDAGLERANVAAECPMGCGFMGNSDLVQVHLLEKHPELFSEDAPATSTLKRVSNRTIRLVLPDNIQQELEISEDASLRDLYDRIEEVTGQKRQNMNIATGGKLLPGKGNIESPWPTFMPSSIKDLEVVHLMCQFRV